MRRRWPPDDDREPVEVFALAKKHETRDAVLYVFPDRKKSTPDGGPQPGREVWIPKSQLQDEDELDEGLTITVTAWLAEKEGLE